MYDVTIVGAGVAGLTCALALQSAGLSCRVLAKDFSPSTLSDRAGALWLPLLAGPRERALQLAERSLAVYAMQAPQEDSPVHEAALVFVTDSPSPPWWTARLGEERLRQAMPEELPEGAAHGVVVLVPVVEPGRYLLSLQDAFQAQGGEVLPGVVRSLAEVEGRLVVNCAGLGAGALTGDRELVPLTRHALLASLDRPTRTLARTSPETGLTVVANLVGGLPAQPGAGYACVVLGREEEGVALDEPAEDVLADVARSALALEPALAFAEIVDAWAAPCPGRYELRLEEDRLPDGRRLIHNYGHGGAGWTLAWGCAEEVVRMVVRPEE